MHAPRFFEDVMRSRSSNPNTLMQSMHLKRFADEGAAQAAAAAEALAQERAAKKAAQGSFRQDVRHVMESTHTERVAKLQRDEAVHAALLKRKVGHVHAAACGDFTASHSGSMVVANMTAGFAYLQQRCSVH